MARDNLDCTDPNTLLDTYPCVTRCASPKELLMVLVLLFGGANGATGDIPLMEQNAAKFRSLSEDQLLKALIAALPEGWFTYFQDEDTWPEAITCIRCYDEQTLKAMLVNQWCTFWSNYAQV